MTADARIRSLNERAPVAGAYVLYWMQQSQRAAANPALEHAIGEANRLGLPVVVGFGLMAGYPDANRRHYAFMLQGLQEVERALKGRGIGLVVRHGPPEQVALGLAADAALAVCDAGYLRHQKQAHTGYMHNHMRMYWAKKILEWSKSPEAAYATALELNNRYFLDGRDASSYANVAWTFGLHDRPWPERPVFGKVRSMTAGGLERKFDMAAYLDTVERLVGAERGLPP